MQAIATPLVPNMEKVQIIPTPKDVDSRILTWKGAAVLGKMDGVSDLWITPEDWVRTSRHVVVGRRTLTSYVPFVQEILGMRGLKERCFYL